MKKLYTRFGCIALAVILVLGTCAGAYAATTTDEISQRETDNAELADFAAAQGTAT